MQWQNRLSQLSTSVTNVAGQVTSTVKELATEVLDNEREIKKEKQIIEEDERNKSNATTTTTRISSNAPHSHTLPQSHSHSNASKVNKGENSSKFESLKSRVAQERSQHGNLLERIRAAKAAKSGGGGTQPDASSPSPSSSSSAVAPSAPPAPAPAVSTLRSTQQQHQQSRAATRQQQQEEEGGGGVGVAGSGSGIGGGDDGNQLISEVSGGSTSGNGAFPVPPPASLSPSSSTGATISSEEKRNAAIIERLETSLRNLSSQMQERESTWKALVVQKDGDILALQHQQRDLQSQLRRQQERHQSERKKAAEEHEEERRSWEREREREREKAAAAAKAPEVEEGKNGGEGGDGEEEEGSSSIDLELIQSLRQEKLRLTNYLLEMQTDQEDQVAHYEEEIQSLTAKMDASTAGYKEQIHELSSKLDSKGYEIMNLQSALGQLTADSELCTKYRSEIQKLEARGVQLEREVEHLKGEGERERIEGEERRQEMDKVRGAQEKSFQESIALKQENLKLRSALQECLEQIKGGQNKDDDDYQVDRRIVVKLLTTYFERGCVPEVLEVMGGILGFTKEEKNKIHQLAKKKGVIRAVSEVPISIVKAPLSLAGNAIGQAKVPESESSLGELWIQFLADSSSLDESPTAEA